MSAILAGTGSGLRPPGVNLYKARATRSKSRYFVSVVVGIAAHNRDDVSPESGVRVGRPLERALAISSAGEKRAMPLSASVRAAASRSSRAPM